MKFGKVAFIVPYPIGRAPSQRFRVEQYIPEMDKAGIDYTIFPFMDANTWQVLYKGGSIVQKGWGILKGFLKRFQLVLIGIHQYDVVFIHREASPLGPPIFEWILTKVWRKKVVFDFDDAIWIPNTSQENKLAASLKAFWKIPKICKWVDTVAGGNDYLCNFAREQGAKNVLYLPTVVNTTNKYNQIKQHEEKAQVAIGWTGSHSTLKYLDALIPVLQQVESETNAQFIVIADKKPDLPLKNLVFVPWNEQTEIEDLLKIDIGLMPLTSDQWSEGKCGFKLIQYLSVGIPAIASPVGVNTRIIEEGKNGYICTNNKEWASAIKSLIADATARQKMGVYGREKMVKEYSIDYAAPVFLESLMKKNT